MNQSLAKRVVAEFVGTAFLLAGVVGSGIMGDRLAAGSVAIALLANTVATAAMLIALISAFGPISGAHLNPVVTLSFGLTDGTSFRDMLAYLLAQLAGALAGVFIANLMFGLPLITLSGHRRSGPAQMLSEFVATLGLVLVIRICAKFRPGTVAFAVGMYIAAGYWFTSSTSFANPAVTFVRSLSDTFTGIRLVDVPVFIMAQLFGGAAATLLAVWLIKDTPVRRAYE